MLDTRRWMLGKAADVHFVDDQVFDRGFERMVRFPIEVVIDQTTTMLIGIVPVRLLAPDIPAADGFGIRIEQNFAGIEAVTLPRRVRTIHAVTVFSILVVQPKNDHGVHVADAELWQERNLDKGRRFSLVKEYQRTRLRIAGVDREVHAACNHCRAEWHWIPDAEFITLIGMRWANVNSLIHH